MVGNRGNRPVRGNVTGTGTQNQQPHRTDWPGLDSARPAVKALARRMRGLEPVGASYETVNA